MYKADIIVGYKRDRIFRLLSNPDSDFPVPSLLFQVARIPPSKGEWGIRLPDQFIIGIRASPTWVIASLQITQGLSGFQRTYKRENGRLHLYGETCHHFALFSYLHPCNKVKSGNVTKKCQPNGVLRNRLNNGNPG